jgi:hypothetical protein
MGPVYGMAAGSEDGISFDMGNETGYIRGISTIFA